MRSIQALLLILATLQSQALAELVIDDFEVGSVDLVFPGFGGDAVSETGLDSQHVASGNRFAGIHNFGGFSSLELLQGEIVFTKRDSGTAYASVSYRFSPPLDITQGDTLDALQLELTDVPDSLIPRGRVLINSSDPADHSTSFRLALPDTLSIPLSEFRANNVDLTRVAFLDMTLDFQNTPGTYSLASIKVVPEPSAGVCLLFCLPALAFVRKR